MKNVYIYFDIKYIILILNIFRSKIRKWFVNFSP